MIPLLHPQIFVFFQVLQLSRVRNDINTSTRSLRIFRTFLQEGWQENFWKMSGATDSLENVPIFNTHLKAALFLQVVLILYISNLDHFLICRTFCLFHINELLIHSAVLAVRLPSNLFAESDNIMMTIILRPDGFQEMTTCNEPFTGPSPGPLHIYT